ncbi:MAG: hypothetical protein J6J35_03970 [Alphaproteobacteria bacterium]|nr:hypothetical protein [Alphaproteobacteria bacterium]MBP3687505.1 hypothetical protein [Alphaproteobacteria bacterium]
MKKVFRFLVFLLLFVCSANEAFALNFNFSLLNFQIQGVNISALNDLTTNITNLAVQIHNASSEMMKFGDMLLCNALHGEASYLKWTVAGWTLEVQFISADIFTSGLILYILGFFIMLISSFYMFDIAFNLGISIILLPLALALWPFGWTREHLKTLISSIVYYTGLFIFLPLGILTAKELVASILDTAFASGGGFDFIEAYNADKSDLLKDNLGIFTMPFFKLLLCYIIALRLIPLFADEFCSHFFDKALVGTPMSERITKVAADLKHRTLDRATRYGKDVLRHQAGSFIENRLGNRNGNFLRRTVARLGRRLARTKRPQR